MDGCPRSESNKGPSLDSQSHMRSKRYSSLEFCIWHVLLYSVIIEVYIYVTVLAGLNTSYNNNIIVKHFRGLVLGLTVVPRRVTLLGRPVSKTTVASQNWVGQLHPNTPRVSFLYRMV